MKPIFPVLAALFLCYHTGTVAAQSFSRTIYGKFYYQSRGNKYPAAYKRVVLMRNNKENLALAENLYEAFDDSTLKKISGVIFKLTNKDGSYEFKNVKTGDYIIRAAGMGGMVIKFKITSDNYDRKKIPDMPADYYYKRMEERRYIQY